MRFALTICIQCILTVWVEAQTVTFNHTYEDGDDNLPLTVLTLDDGYLTIGTGYSDQIGGWLALKILHTDLEGNLVWTKHYGEYFQGYFGGGHGSAKMTSDGNFILSGFIGDTSKLSDLWLVKFDVNGDTIWSKKTDRLPYDFLYNIIIQPNGDIVCVGSIGGQYLTQGLMYMVCYDSLGNYKWENHYGGTGFNCGYFIQSTLDKGFVVGGVTGGSNRDGWLVKTDSLGVMKWNKKIGSTTGSDSPVGVELSEDGGYYVWGGIDSVYSTGYTPSFAYIYKLDSVGGIVWKKEFFSRYDKTVYQVRVYNNFIYFSGFSSENPENEMKGWFGKMTFSGDVVWERQYDNTESEVKGDIFHDFQSSTDGGFIVTGYASSPSTSGGWTNRLDFWLVRLDSNGCLYPEGACETTAIEELEEETVRVLIYPNPSTGTLHIETTTTGHIKLYNLLGGEMLTQPLTGTHTILDVTTLPLGVYLYKIEVKERLQTGKLIVE